MSRRTKRLLILNLHKEGLVLPFLLLASDSTK